jgi:hypothetical protein
VTSSDKKKALETVYHNMIHSYHDEGTFECTENWELLMELTWDIWKSDMDCLMDMITDAYDVDDYDQPVREVNIVKAIDKKCKIAILKKLS